MNLFKKHERVLRAAVDYYVNNVPTGLTDEEYNLLESEALNDGIDPRYEAFKLLRGSWVDNADYITDVPKEQVPGSMYDAIKEFSKDYFNYPAEGNIYAEMYNLCEVYWIPKYDGSSVVCYYENGQPYKVVTAGGLNKSGQGVDQTWKLLKYFPEIDYRIKALHCEVLISLEHGYGEKSRQHANGLINSTKDDMLDKVDECINIRAFRYFTDYEDMDYLDTLRSLPRVTDDRGDVKFAPGYTLSYNEMFGINSDYYMTPEEMDKDVLVTDTGTFLIDGWVAYSRSGEVIKALKYKDAGRGEFTKVVELRWNDQSGKGKDSWSCNAVIEPIIVRGSTVTKPSCPVNKIIKDGLGIGSLVSVILANSTIPKVDKVSTKSDNVNLPTCPCGTLITLDSVFGNNLKCPNPDCSYRYQNMTKYLDNGELDNLLEDNLEYYSPSSLNSLFIIDRFDFWKKITDKVDFGSRLYNIISNDLGDQELYELIMHLGLTGLQVRNLGLVYKPAYKALRYRFNKLINNNLI